MPGLPRHVASWNGSLTDEVPSSVFLRLRAGLRALRDANGLQSVELSIKRAGFNRSCTKAYLTVLKAPWRLLSRIQREIRVVLLIPAKGQDQSCLAIAVPSLPARHQKRASTTSTNRRSTGSPPARRARRSISASRGARATPRRRATRRPRSIFNPSCSRGGHGRPRGGSTCVRRLRGLRSRFVVGLV